MYNDIILDKDWIAEVRIVDLLMSKYLYELILAVLNKVHNSDQDITTLCITPILHINFLP